jgi:hypothetical protein
MSPAQIESRIAALEREVQKLKGHLEANGARWWEHVAGTFADDRLFLRAARLGRIYRQGQRRTTAKKR